MKNKSLSIADEDFEIQGLDKDERYTSDTSKMMRSWLESSVTNGSEQTIKLKQRVLENEQLRKFIIDLRDNPLPISAEQVIQRLVDKTENMTP